MPIGYDSKLEKKGELMSSSSEQSDIQIRTFDRGFFTGLNPVVTLASLLLTVLFLVWVIFDPNAGGTLTSWQKSVGNLFGRWYIYVAAFYLIVCLILALYPKFGRVKLGKPEDEPEFSRFSWFAMMFGAGLGVGMLTFAVAEPIYHIKDNPDVILGLASGVDANNTVFLDNVRPAFKWTLLHYGLTAWGIYGLVGMAMAYFSYNRGLPLSMRSGLQPLFGKALSGPLGHLVDISAIVATITGVGYTISLGVTQFSFGVSEITNADWLMTSVEQTDGSSKEEPAIIALLLSLGIIMIASTLSAISGVGKGIKWLSNLNMGLSFFLLLFFAVFGAASGALGFAAKHYVLAIWDYLYSIISLSFTYWGENGNLTNDLNENVSKELSDWQKPWTILYWAWWIAFAPFVGLFLARVSKGRTIREFVFGAMMLPSLMCLVWFVLAGGSALFAELNGDANGAILTAHYSNQLYETANVILTEGSASALFMLSVIVVLLVTYLVTSADSAILVITTIASGGIVKDRKNGQTIFWGILLGLVVGVLLLVGQGGVDAIKAAMLIGALPFSFVVALMGIALMKDLLTR